MEHPGRTGCFWGLKTNKMADRLVRCFIAVKLPAQIKKRLAAVQFKLKKHALNAKWTDPSAFHLTLHFLGEIPFSDIGGIGQAMDDATSQIYSFQLRVAGLGVFPSFRKPRIIWAGIEDDAGALKRLHSRLSKSLAASGLRGKKQKFSPHVTLGRMRQPVRGNSVEKALSKVQIQDKNGFDVKDIHLYESILYRSGAVHTILKTSDLN